MKILGHLVFVFAMLAMASVRAADCFPPLGGLLTLPPSNALPASKSHDDLYLGWCTQNVFSAIFNGLHLDGSDWSGGFGTNESNNGYVADCDANSFLGKLMNAGFIVREVQKHSVKFGEHRSVSGLDGPYDKYDHGHWWEFASSTDPDEWVPSCDTDDGNATNYPDPAGYIALKIPGAYKVPAVNRAAIVVHEPTHQDVSHIGDDECKNGGSCDDKYSHYNSNTMHINFLFDLAGTYLTEGPSSDPVQVVQMLNGQCKFIPRFLDDERQAALSKVEVDLKKRFKYAEPPWTTHYGSGASGVAALDAARNPVFECKQCSPDSYTFHPGVCQQKTACNEVLNSDNGGKNLLNRVACSVYNSLVGQASSASAVASAKAGFNAAKKACLPASEKGARAYCEAQKAAAKNVGQVDACGWLDPVFYTSINKLQCVQEYCRDRFVASGGWPVSSDPYDCLDYLCEAGGSCGDAGSPQQCKAQFVKAQGDPAYYLAPCESNQCKATLVSCLNAQTSPPWSYGDPIPAACSDQVSLCELFSHLIVLVWAEYEPLTGPSPVEDQAPNVSSPARELRRFLRDFREAAQRGAPPAELAMAAVKLTSQPELVSALFNEVPEEFVSMFGTEGFESIVGSNIRRTQAKPIQRERLGKRGIEALDRLQALASRSPSALKGAIGQFMPH